MGRHHVLSVPAVYRRYRHICRQARDTEPSTLSNTKQALGLIVYRLYLHPLSKYPGPLLGRITDWYSVYQAWKGYRHLDLYELHQKYGKVVRYGPDKISINSAAALSDIYGYKSNVRKAQFYSAFPATKGAWSTHSAIDKALHARKRRVLSQGFSDAAMKGLQPHILSVIRTFTEAVGDFPSRLAFGSSNGTPTKKEPAWSTPKDMGLWANYMSYDVLGDICYGESFDTIERADNRFAINLVARSSQFHYLNAQMPGLKKLGLDRLFFKDLRANRLRFMQYSRARLQKRMQLGTDTDRRDFFYFLLKAKDPETGLGFSQQELWGESNVLLIAVCPIPFPFSFPLLLSSSPYTMISAISPPTNSFSLSHRAPTQPPPPSPRRFTTFYTTPRTYKPSPP